MKSPKKPDDELARDVVADIAEALGGEEPTTREGIVTWLRQCRPRYTDGRSRRTLEKWAGVVAREDNWVKLSLAQRVDAWWTDSWVAEAFALDMRAKQRRAAKRRAAK